MRNVCLVKVTKFSSEYVLVRLNYISNVKYYNINSRRQRKICVKLQARAPTRTFTIYKKHSLPSD